MGMLLCRDCTAVGGGLKVYIEQSELDLCCGQCARDRDINRVGGQLRDRERQPEIPPLDAGGKTEPSDPWNYFDHAKPN